MYCNKCKMQLPEEYGYCMACGNKAEKRKKYTSVKRPEIFECVYGIPYRAKFVCGKCGKAYVCFGLGGPRGVNYCPFCGEKYESSEITVTT